MSVSQPIVKPDLVGEVRACRAPLRNEELRGSVNAFVAEPVSWPMDGHTIVITPISQALAVLGRAPATTSRGGSDEDGGSSDEQE